MNVPTNETHDPTEVLDRASPEFAAFAEAVRALAAAAEGLGAGSFLVEFTPGRRRIVLGMSSPLYGTGNSLDVALASIVKDAERNRRGAGAVLGEAP